MDEPAPAGRPLLDGAPHGVAHGTGIRGEQHGGLAAAAQLVDELAPGAAAVADHDPTVGGGAVARAGRRPRQQQGLTGGVAIGRLRQRGGPLEATGAEDVHPAAVVEQRVVGAQVGVAEPPPPVGQAEGDIDPAARSQALDEHEEPARRQQLGERARGTGAGRPSRAARWRR